MDKKTLKRQGIGIGINVITSEFANRILMRAADLNMNKGELAKKAGISAPTLRSILNMGTKTNKEMPHLETIIALAYALKSHPYWLIEGLFNNIDIPSQLEIEVTGDRAGFVSDVTYPDGSLVAPGTRFLKKWRVQNLGDTPWINRKLICWDEEVQVISKRTGQTLHAAQALKPDAREITTNRIKNGHFTSCVEINEVIDLEMWFTAPTISGTFVSYWVAVEEDGSLCYDESAALWTVINVTTLADTVGFTPKMKV